MNGKSEMRAILVRFNIKVNGSQYVLAQTRHLNEISVFNYLDEHFDPSNISYKFIRKQWVKDLKVSESFIKDLYDEESFVAPLDEKNMESKLKDLYEFSHYKEHHI